MPEYPQDIYEVTTEPSTPLRVVHAPNSLLHLEQRKAQRENIEYKTFSENPSLVLPRTDEIMQVELNNQLQEKVSKLSPSKRQATLNFLNETHNPELYGEYQPNNFKNKPYETGESIDPSKYLANYLLDVSTELPEGKQLELVFHPDIIFFLTQGEGKKKEQEVLESINRYAKELNLKIFFENLILSNPKYKAALPWMEDPFMINHKMERYSNLGTTIDLEHLTKSGWDDNRITQTVGDLISRNKRDIIIHARDEHPEKYTALYQKASLEAVPWVNESGYSKSL